MAFKRIGFAVSLAAALVIGSATFTQNVAEAQTMPTQVESVPKGSIGLGLVGVEIGFFLPAVIGLHDAWAFIVFPLAFGAGGAVGGYFAFDEPNTPEGGVAMLAIGMALIVPTLVLTLVLTSYDPGDEQTQDPDQDLHDEFGNDDAEPDGGDDSARRQARERLVAGAGLLHVGSEQVSLGVPGLSIRPSLTAEELQRYGGNQDAELHIPVVSGAF